MERTALATCTHGRVPWSAYRSECEERKQNENRRMVSAVSEPSLLKTASNWVAQAAYEKKVQDVAFFELSVNKLKEGMYESEIYLLRQSI